DRVRSFLANEAYEGEYVFGRTQSQLDPRNPDGRRIQVAQPESQWIRKRGLLPAYIEPESKRRFLEQLSRNAFHKRHRPSGGRPLLHGLLECAICAGTLSVADPGARAGQHYYQCTARSSRYGVPPCLSIPGRGPDAAIERLFLAVLDPPPMSALEKALNDARAQERIRTERVEHERKRLLSLERRAKERFADADHHFPFAWEYAQKELNDAIQARRLFEQRLASEPAPQKLPNEAELQKLGRIVADGPALWRDPEVTNPERNAMLASVIDRIRVSRTDEFIQMEVQWAGGLVTPLRIHRRRGIEQLVRALHQEGMTVAEVRQRLAQGGAETGERCDYTA